MCSALRRLEPSGRCCSEPGHKASCRSAASPQGPGGPRLPGPGAPRGHRPPSQAGDPEPGVASHGVVWPRWPSPTVAVAARGLWYPPALHPCGWRTLNAAANKSSSSEASVETVSPTCAPARDGGRARSSVALLHDSIVRISFSHLRKGRASSAL